MSSLIFRHQIQSGSCRVLRTLAASDKNWLRKDNAYEPTNDKDTLFQEPFGVKVIRACCKVDRPCHAFRLPNQQQKLWANTHHANNSSCALLCDRYPRSGIHKNILGFTSISALGTTDQVRKLMIVTGWDMDVSFGASDERRIQSGVRGWRRW